MAIIKSKTLANGSSGNYWRILNITIDRQGFKVNTQVALFKDQATSDAGHGHLGLIKNFSFNFSMSEIGSQNIITYMYGKILTAANTMITRDVQGRLLETPVPYDPDIAGGING